MVEANAKCPKCGRGTMKLIPSPEQLAPKLPEQDKLAAECDNCGHKDEVKVVATDE
jgi:DNA-directed RNA polymerase subunit RPC12/RpoP